MTEENGLSKLGFKDVSEPKPKAKAIFKNRKVILDDTHAIGICTKDDIDQDVLREEYTVAQFKVDLLRHLLRLAKNLEPFTDDKDMFILLPTKKAMPVFITGGNTRNKNVYALAPRASEWLKVDEEKH